MRSTRRRRELCRRRHSSRRRFIKAAVKGAAYPLTMFLIWLFAVLFLSLGGR